MIFDKRNKTDKIRKIDLKKEETILEVRAKKIIENEEPTIGEKIQSGNGDIFSAISNIKKWAIDSNFEQKTKEYLRLSTDGIVQFIDGLLKESK